MDCKKAVGKLIENHAPLSSIDTGVISCYEDDIPKLPTGEPQPNNLFMVNNNLLNIPKGDNTMKNLNSKTVSSIPTQVFDINEYKIKIAKLNSLTEYSKDLKARLEVCDKTIEALKNNLASLNNEVDNKLAALEEEVALDEETIEAKNLEISELETLINSIHNVEYSVPTAPSSEEDRRCDAGSADPSPLVVKVPTAPSSASTDVGSSDEGRRCDNPNSKFEREQATSTFTRKELEAKLGNIERKIDFSIATHNLDETLATPEGKAQIVEGLNSLVKDEVSKESLLTYEELVKGNIFSKRTEDGFLPDVLVSTILSKLNKAIAVDKANAVRVCKDFKNHHNPVLTKAQKKLFMTFIRSNKVS